MADNLFTRIVQAAPDLNRNFILTLGRAPLSYGDAFAMAARFAHVLARHDVKPGDRVAVQVEKSPEALFLYLACLRLGAIYLPLNSDYTANELGYFAGDAEPQVFICSDKNREKIAAASFRINAFSPSMRTARARWLRKPRACLPNFPMRRWR